MEDSKAYDTVNDAVGELTTEELFELLHEITDEIRLRMMQDA